MKTITTCLAIIIFFFSYSLKGQSFTSIADGSWTNGSNWTNTSGGSTPTPPINNDHSWGSIAMQHDMFIASDYTIASATLNVLGGGNLAVSGSMTLNGGSAVNVYGELHISGDLTLNGTLNVFPGGKVIVDGTVTVNSSTYLNIGTNVSSPPYADMVIRGNLIAQSSGDVTINQNGRLAIFGDVTDSGGGGTFLRVNDGGQVYVDGDITYTGGGSNIENNNSTAPFGLYVNGTASTNTGSGGTTTTNIGDKSTMQTTNPDFYNWVASQSSSPLPISLLFFKAEAISQSSVHLTWATVSEINFDYFSLERSKDGFSFTELAKIKGKGNAASRNNYSFNDSNPLSGTAYYRLRSVDVDGYTEVFKMISVNVSAEDNVKIFPNPVVDGTIHIEFNFLPSQEDLLSIYDLNGAILKQFSGLSQVNTQKIDLSPGIYLAKLSHAASEEIFKIIVR